MDGMNVNANQPCRYSHFALQNMLSKTADKQNHNTSAGLDSDTCPKCFKIGQGMTKANTCIFFL